MVNGNGIIRRCQLRELSGAYPRIERRFNQARNGAKPDLAVDKRGYRHLIGRIEDSGRAATGPERVIGQSKSREPLEVWRLESQLSNLGKVELCRRPDDAIRPAKAMRDRGAHIGRAELGDDG